MDAGKRILMCLAPALLAGCYTYTRAPAVLEPGARVSLEINDLGRMQLAEHVGPSVVRIDGWLVSSDDSVYTLRVEKTTNLRGGTVPWSGEQTTIRKAWIDELRLKQFSASRTIIASTALAAGMVGFIATKGFGLSVGSSDQGGGGGGSQSIQIH